MTFLRFLGFALLLCGAPGVGGCASDDGADCVSACSDCLDAAACEGHCVAHEQCVLAARTCSAVIDCVSGPWPPGQEAACEMGVPRDEAGDDCSLIVGTGLDDPDALCFEAHDVACACAGCPDDCAILDSHPQQAVCH
jgi:hypothetical protein